MNLTKSIRLACNEFKQKMTEFCQNHDISKLTAESAELFTSGLKYSLAAAGRTAFHDFIIQFECVSDVIWSQEKIYRYKQHSPKEYLTAFGKIPIRRKLYQQDKGDKSIVPLEQKWGMVNEFATDDVRESICYAAGFMTPVEVEQLLKKSALFQPSSTAIKHIIEKVGNFTEEHKEAIADTILEQETVPEQTQAMVFSLDGVNVLINEPGKKKGRKLQRPKLGSYQNDDKTSFKNAMLGSISFYKTCAGKPFRLESRYVSRMPEPKYPTFKHFFEKEVNWTRENSPPDAHRIIIVDGHKSIRGYLRNHPMVKGALYLVDYYHAAEHLSKASEAIFGKSSERAKAWFKKWKDKMKICPDGAENAYRSMKNYNVKLSKRQQQALKPELTFFKNNKAHMKYAFNVENGLPIGNGPVEAGCKCVVRTRMCRSGMRWSRKGGQNILNFRTMIKSNRWERFWKEYQTLKKAA